MLHRRIDWGTLALFLAVIGLIVAGVVVAITRGDHSAATNPPPLSGTVTVTSQPSPASSLQQSPTPPATTEGALASDIITSRIPIESGCRTLPNSTPDKAQLCNKLTGFVRAYYTRKAGDTTATLKKRLAPYVPNNVLSNMHLSTNYSDTVTAYMSEFKGSDIAAISYSLDGSKIEATAIGPEHHITVRMPVIVTLSKPDGSLLRQYELPPQIWPSSDWIFTSTKEWTMTRFTP